MSKRITFNDTENDQALVKKIETYRKQKKLASFTQAVRELCEKGLLVEKLKK